MALGPFPDVYVKAVAITRGIAILTILNESWGSFSLPMSKTRTWADPEGSPEVIEEPAEDTAIRVLAEALGRPLEPHEVPKHHPVHSLDPYNQSGRDGSWKCYHIELFQFELPAGETPKPWGGAPFAWMTLEEMERLKPVSLTALMRAREMKASANR